MWYEGVQVGWDYPILQYIMMQGTAIKLTPSVVGYADKETETHQLQYAFKHIILDNWTF